jgi:hypothetical protein
MIKVMIYDDGVVLAKSDFDAELMQPYQDGIALTYDQLEQLKRETVKDFIKWAVDVGYLYANLTLEDYERMYFKQATKKDGE